MNNMDMADYLNRLINGSATGAPDPSNYSQWLLNMPAASRNDLTQPGKGSTLVRTLGAMSGIGGAQDGLGGIIANAAGLGGGLGMIGGL